MCRGAKSYKVLSVDGSVYLLLGRQHKQEVIHSCQRILLLYCILSQVWSLDESGERKERMGWVGSVWPGLARSPDAGFTWTNGLTYLFTGQSILVISSKEYISFTMFFFP